MQWPQVDNNDGKNVYNQKYKNMEGMMTLHFIHGLPRKVALIKGWRPEVQWWINTSDHQLTPMKGNTSRKPPPTTSTHTHRQHMKFFFWYSPLALHLHLSHFPALPLSCAHHRKMPNVPWRICISSNKNKWKELHKIGFIKHIPKGMQNIAEKSSGKEFFFIHLAI